MKQELKQRWIEALRSGDYQQGIGQLRSKNDEFCCLAVLCSVFDPSGWESATDAKTMGYDYDYIYKNNVSFGTLHWFLRLDALELDDLAQGRLIAMNDKGVSFAEIADWIEENL